MLNENRKKLVEVMETLGFPLTPDNIESKVKAMSEEEVADLLSVYSDVVDYEKSMEEFAKEADPEEYKKLVKEKNSELDELENKYLNESELIQEQGDLELDAMDAKLEQGIKDVVGATEEAVEILESTPPENVSGNTPNQVITN